MANTKANGITIEYDTFGDPANPPLLLVMGLGAQMISWAEGFCEGLANKGHHVIRFDNRDVGLSEKIESAGVPDVPSLMAARIAGQEVTFAYTLGDMAADAVGLLDHLGIERAHVMGASMGGMIAQTLAINHPDRVRSLISVMSQPGEPDVGQPTEAAAIAIFAPPPTSRQEYLDSSPRWMVWQSQKYRDEARVRENAARSYDRSFYPEGAPRQMAAMFGSGRRTDALSQLDVPTLVIHGRDDQLITPDGGFRTAELIPGAHLLFVADMGHDMPEPLWPLLVDAVLSHTSGA